MVFVKGDVINVIGFNDFLIPVINYWEEEGYKVEISYDYRIRNKDYKLYLVIDTPNGSGAMEGSLGRIKRSKG